MAGEFVCVRLLLSGPAPKYAMQEPKEASMQRYKPFRVQVPITWVVRVLPYQAFPDPAGPACGPSLRCMLASVASSQLQGLINQGLDCAHFDVCGRTDSGATSENKPQEELPPGLGNNWPTLRSV